MKLKLPASAQNLLPKEYQPFKAPVDHITNEIFKALDPSLYSWTNKLNGIRMLVYKGHIYSKALKRKDPVKFSGLYEYFHDFLEFSKTTDTVFEGEFYTSLIPFFEILSYWATHNKEIPVDINIKFHIFDRLHFFCRYENYLDRNKDWMDFFANVVEIPIKSFSNYNIIGTMTLKQWVKEVVEYQGVEGIIIRKHSGIYKYGRATLKEATIFKAKPLQDFDGEIVEVIQATRVDPDAEKSTNDMGYSVTSKKKEDRILVPMAASFRVKYKDTTVKVSLGSMRDAEKFIVWRNRKEYLGLVCEYLATMDGAKNVPWQPKYNKIKSEEE